MSKREEKVGRVSNGGSSDPKQESLRPEGALATFFIEKILKIYYNEFYGAINNIFSLIHSNRCDYRCCFF